MKAAMCSLTLPLGADTECAVSIAKLLAKRYIVHWAALPSRPVAFEGGTVARLMFSPAMHIIGQLFYVSGMHPQPHRPLYFHPVTHAHCDTHRQSRACACACANAQIMQTHACIRAREITREHRREQFWQAHCDAHRQP